MPGSATGRSAARRGPRCSVTENRISCTESPATWHGFAVTEQPPAGPPPYQPPFQPPPGPPSYPPAPQAPPTQPGWGQPPPPPPGWGPGPPLGPPSQPPPGRKSRAGLVIAIVAAVLVLAAAVIVPVVLLADDDEDNEAGPDGTTSSTSATEPASTDLSEVKVYEDLDPSHVPLGQAVTYDQVPPAGGNHWSEWLDCGAYDEQVADENGVHDLEHGAVWITYDPDLSGDDVAALADQLPQNGIMSPYDDLPAPVVITVWERQLYLTGADDPRIPLFIEEFDDGVTAPEAFASCAGGTAALPAGA